MSNLSTGANGWWDMASQSPATVRPAASDEHAWQEMRRWSKKGAITWVSLVECLEKLSPQLSNSAKTALDMRQLQQGVDLSWTVNSCEQLGWK